VGLTNLGVSYSSTLLLYHMASATKKPLTAPSASKTTTGPVMVRPPPAKKISIGSKESKLPESAAASTDKGTEANLRDRKESSVTSKVLLKIADFTEDLLKKKGVLSVSVVPNSNPVRCRVVVEKTHDDVPSQIDGVIVDVVVTDKALDDKDGKMKQMVTAKAIDDDADQAENADEGGEYEDAPEEAAE